LMMSECVVRSIKLKTLRASGTLPLLTLSYLEEVTRSCTSVDIWLTMYCEYLARVHNAAWI